MKKRKYLRRLVIVMLLGFVIPMVIFLEFFWKSAAKEIEQTNDAFYKKTLDSYVDMFDKKMEEFEKFAAKICVESKETDSWLWRGQEGLSANTYHVYKAVKELQEKYSRTDVREWGIYFYDIDKIITSEYSYSSEHFIYKYAGKSGELSGCADFFSESRYNYLDILFDTTNTEDSCDGDLFMGVCSRIGQSNDKVLIFFVLAPKDVQDSLAIVGGEGIAFYLNDRIAEQIMLGWGDISQESTEIIKKMLGAEMLTTKIEEKNLYILKSKYPQFSVSAYISEDSMRSNIVEWAFRMRMILLGTVVVLLFVCLIIIAVTYKPIYDLVSKLNYSGEGEFDVIRNVLEAKQTQLEEQEMMIMDLLINHLIYGVPISDKRIKRLGIEESFQYYCVLLMEGYHLSSGEADELNAEMVRDGRARTFVTDWPTENCSIVIAFLKEKDVSILQKNIERWREENFLPEGYLYTGKVYDKLDQIQLSFRSCLEQRKKRHGQNTNMKVDTETLNPKYEQQKKMKEEILAYMEIHFRDSNLSQMDVADYFHISIYRLSRLFKAQMGVGFAEYLVAKRLEYAKELLITTSYSIREVAIMSGFTSENYFSRTFKLYEEVSPSSFRKK